MFLVKGIKNLDTRLKIFKNVTFSTTNTRSTSFLKLSPHYRLRTNLSRHFYFNRASRLWNALHLIDLNLSSNIIKVKVKNYLWSYFVKKFNPHMTCSFHFACPYVKCMSIPLPSNYFLVLSCNNLFNYLLIISFNGILYHLWSCFQYIISFYSFVIAHLLLLPLYC